VLQIILTALLLAIGSLQAVQNNEPAVHFSLRDSHHTVRTLDSYKNKIIFINFWASWCAPCQEELPELNKLAEAYKSKRVVVVTINVDSDPQAARTLLAKLGLKDPHFQILWDTASKAVGAYDIATMPYSFVVDQKGIVRYSHSGYHSHDSAKWRSEIDGLLVQAK
jgi:thiol-disulfide isomerase/thioredoxin